MARVGNQNVHRRVVARSRSIVVRSHRLLVESLERRGMLSATVGSLSDVSLSDSDSPSDEADPAEVRSDFDWGCVGLPSGLSLAVCPVVDPDGSVSGEIAPTPSDTGFDQLVDTGAEISGVVDVTGLLVCTGYPVAFNQWPEGTIVTEDTPSDEVTPPDYELAPEPTVCGGINPIIIVDPVIVDPTPVDPADFTNTVAPPDTELPLDDSVSSDEDPGGVVDPEVKPFLPLAVADDVGEKTDVPADLQTEPVFSTAFVPEDSIANSRQFAAQARASQSSSNFAAAMASLGNFSAVDADAARLPGGKRRGR